LVSIIAEINWQSTVKNILNRLRTKLYDQRYFNFPIVNFPFICSNMSTATADGVYIYLSWSDIPELWFLPWFSWLMVVANKKLLHQGSHHFESFTVSTMTWLTVTKYLCHKWPQICSDCRNHNPVLSSFMTYHRVCNKNNTTDPTWGAGTVYPSGAHEFALGFW
jgi:hypothetical protein